MDIPAEALLNQWQSYVTTISRNLMELSGQNDVKIIKLKLKDAADGYTGLTKVKAQKAADDLDRLWRYYSILSGVVDRARELLSRDSFLKDTEADVKILLENTPVTLETERIDISSRSLLTPDNVQTKASLQELLKIMQESFESTRNTFIEITRSAETLEARLKAIEKEINCLNSTVKRLGIKSTPLFDVGKAARIGSDPLGGLQELHELSLGLEKYRASIKSAEQDYNETANMLNRSNDMLCEIEDLAGRLEQAAVESRKIFSNAFSARPVFSREVLKSLRDWLDVLKSKLAEGNLNAAKIGAGRLESECLVKLNLERENYLNAARDYNEWLDLKGIFKALLAKLGGLKARGMSFDKSLDDLIDNTRASLYGNNVNLTVCRQLIEKLHASLKG